MQHIRPNPKKATLWLRLPANFTYPQLEFSIVAAYSDYTFPDVRLRIISRNAQLMSELGRVTSILAILRNRIGMKTRNFRITAEMTLDELKDTDLGAFLQAL